MILGLSTRRRFADLSEQEVLALAISSEEDDARIYRTFAEQLRADYPASAAVFDKSIEICAVCSMQNNVGFFLSWLDLVNSHQ